MEPALTFQITFLGQEIAQIGNLNFAESSFLLELVSQKVESNIVRIEHQYANPYDGEGVYINLKTAIQWSGLNEARLRELCESETIEAKPTESGWLIMWDSLKKFLQKQRFLTSGEGE